MSKGIIFFAVNNEKIDYTKLAYLATKFVKHNMGDIPVSLITDEQSLLWDSFKEIEKDFTKILDKIIITGDQSDFVKNTRIYRDTNYHSITAEFKNTNRMGAYELSPYDETLLLDVDYLVLSDVLNHVWGNEEDILINCDAINLEHKKLEGPEFRLNPYGIKMYWATAIYFKKSARVKLLFDFVSHIKDHWDFYKLVYDFPGGLYRNDYAFSIALHMLNGFLENKEIKPLPGGPILTLKDIDQIFEISDLNQIKAFINDSKETWKFYANTISGVNVHCMNKLSILNNFDKIIGTINV